MRGTVILFNIILALILSGQGLFSQIDIINSGQKTYEPVFDICFTPGGSALAAAEGCKIILYNTIDGSVIRELKGGHMKGILCLDISPDSALIAAGSKDSTITIWSRDTGKLIKRFKLHDGIVTSVRFSPVGDYLFSSGTDSNICLVSIESEYVILKKHISEKIITSIDISSDGKMLVAVGADGKAVLYDAMTCEVLSVLGKKMGWLRDVAFSNDDRLLITAGDKGIITRWEMKNGNFILKDSGKKSRNWIYGVSIMDDNQSYAFCGFDKKVIVSIEELDYYIDTGFIVFKVKFKPQSGVFPRIAVATTHGMKFLNVSSMNLKNN